MTRLLVDRSNAVVALDPDRRQQDACRPPRRHRQAAADHAGLLADALGVDVRTVASEPAAARTGALTTPGGRPDALVVDLGAGTIDAIAPGSEVVAAGAGALLTRAVATTLGVPRAAADWIKRGPCLRVEGGQRIEAEDGSRGFLERPAPPRGRSSLVAPPIRWACCSTPTSVHDGSSDWPAGRSARR